MAWPVTACYACARVEEQSLKEPKILGRNVLLVLSAAVLAFALPAAAQQGKFSRNIACLR